MREPFMRYYKASTKGTEQMTSAKITIEIEITVSGEADSASFEVKEIAAVTGYNSVYKIWSMSEGFVPDKLFDLIQTHFSTDALIAIEEQAGEDYADYMEGRADAAYERAQQD